MELPSFCSVLLRNLLASDLKIRALGQKLALFITNNIKTLTGVSLIAIWGMAASAQDYTHAMLKKDVANFLANHYEQEQHERLDINVGNLDSRLRLERCTESLTFALQDPTGLGGNISVQTRCPTAQGWALHLPAQVMIHRYIPVAARAITRGEQLTAAHLTNQLVNISSIRQGYALRSENIIGKEAKRNIGQGEPIKTGALDAITAIRRGETVTLKAQTGSINVISAGIALADGRIGQKIRVRNSSSERIVTGTVLTHGVVQIL